MSTLSTHVTSVPATIPLLDASDLPYADDWAVLEAIAGDGEFELADEHRVPRRLGASDLPYADDWAGLGALAGDGEFGIDAEPDVDRFGQFRVSASFDE